MIEEVSEVNSRKGGNLTPGRSQKPCVAGPGCGREGGLSYTEARVTNLPHACGRTKDVLSSFDAAPSKLGNVRYLDPSSAVPSGTRGKSEEGLSIVKQNTVHTRSDGMARHVHGTLVPFTPHQAYSGKGVALRPLYRCAEVELRLHNGKEGQVLYGILVMSKCLSGSGPMDKSIFFEAHYCDPASAALVQLEGQERGGDEGKSYLAGIVATDNVTVTDT